MSTIESLPPTSQRLLQAYREIREFTQRIVEPLSPEDCSIQSMPDVSPIRWHLAHTTWFFETFALRDQPSYCLFDQEYHHLFNSYYNTLGAQYPRAQRGLISRPSLAEVMRYRRHVDNQIAQRLADEKYAESIGGILHIGLQHEQQHQELMLTDIKHILSCNPLRPSYLKCAWDHTEPRELQWCAIDAGVYEIGHAGDHFAFDNESPRHRVYLQPCQVANQLVNCGDYIRFLQEGGYRRPELWLSEGWCRLHQEQWQAPLYWIHQDGCWWQYTLCGLAKVRSEWPVCHLSYFEADAYARWAGARLPTEFEWEVLASIDGEHVELSQEPFADYLFEHELAVHPTRSPRGYMGGLWQWTSSSYAAYPGYRAPPGALGEYNGKFMCNQYVLRGGSVATSRAHIRSTYRNFFPAHTRWQFSGLRLARS